MQITEVKRSRELENARLKRLLADWIVEIDQTAGVAGKKVLAIKVRRSFKSAQIKEV